MTNREIIKRFFEPIYWSNFLKYAIIRSMIYPLFHGFIVIASVKIIQLIIQSGSDGNNGLIQQYGIYYIGILLFRFILRIISKNWGYAEIRPIGYNVLFKKVLQQYTQLESTYIEKIGTGRSQHIIDKGINSWILVISETVIKLSGFISKIGFGLLLVFSIKFVYGLIFIVLILLISYSYILTQNKANIYRKIRKNMLIERSRDVIRIIMSKFEILQSGKIQYELTKYDNRLLQRLPLNQKVETQRLISESFAALLLDGLKILSIFMLIYNFGIGKIIIADFVAIIMILNILDDITFKRSRFYIDMSKERVNIEKLRQLFDTTPQIHGYDTGEQFMFKNGTIQLRDIAFCYDQPEIQHENSTATVFHKFSLDISGGKKTALVGASGSGKSTLVKLIAGYLRPDRGSVIVDEQDLTSVSLKSYYQHIGYLTQEPSVFDGTIRENLLYGAQDILHNTQETSNIDRVLSLSKCERVYDLPQGLDTEIGERGVRLSGGQRQRLAIAKIMIKDPKIIILDEPTSALDSFAEEAITQAMHNLFAGRTVIIIAHRLQTVKAADDIIVIEQGHIIERGTHDELVQHGGSYAKMLELQAGF